MRHEHVHRLLRLAAPLLALLLVHCSSEDTTPAETDTSSDAGLDVGADAAWDGGTVPECTPGTVLCECTAGACPGGAGLACIDDVCVYPDCEIGTEDCACTASGGCGLDEWGRQLVCNEGVCIEDVCTAGTIGCECAVGDECFDEMLCTEGICQPLECEETGTLGCACNSDRSCDTGLACVLGACVDPGDCTVGSDGCPCNRDSSCDAGATCDLTTDLCEAIDCTIGEVGCACNAGDTCNAANAICTGGVCEIENCEAGLEGCECAAGNVCGENDLGESLTCIAGTCESPSCSPGDTGCVCERGVLCDDDTDVCTDGYCMAADCTAGTEGCSCINDVFCSGTLGCRDGIICADLTGYSGGRCYEDDTCARGNLCVGGLCAACTLGTNGCQCDSADDCVSGLTCTAAGYCVPDEDLVSAVPDDPICYSYCNDDIELEDGWVSCSAEGLFEGCVDELECVEGSCVVPGTDPPVCATDVDCPLYQTCIEGQCYSTCQSDSQCATDVGETCYMHVCRTECEVDADDGSSTCPSDMYCERLNGLRGLCLPIVGDDESVELTEVEAEFEVSESYLDFDNINEGYWVEITHSAATTETFRIRKLEHQAFFDDGTGEDLMDPDGDGETCDPLVDCPLYWMSLYEAGAAEVGYESEIEIEVERGDTVRFFVGNAGGSTAIEWTGSLEIINDTLGVRQITMTYRERPEGTWHGSMYYYSQFDTRNLDEWVANRDSASAQSNVRNAFVQRWAAFRRADGSLTWDEMRAVMTATETGQWEPASELDECPVEACYYYSDSVSGVSEYSSSLTLAPVPTGLTELPITLNLRQPFPSTNPELLEGRIESNETLHYAGNPAISLQMQDLPDDGYHFEVGGLRFTYLESMESTIYVGGRYRTTSTDTSCSQRGDGSYDLFAVPWLLPDFQADTFSDGTGLLYRYECRDRLVPFDTSEDEGAESTNLSMALANPLPDARTRVRELTLLDGVILNGSIMVILFEEQMSAFDEDSDPISAYGYIVLRRSLEAVDDTDVSPNDGIADVYQGEDIDLEGRVEPTGVLTPTCSDDVLDRMGIDELDEDNVVWAIEVLVNGIATGEVDEIGPGSDETVHYFCEDTGLIDGGPDHVTDDGVLMDSDDRCLTAGNGICEDGGPTADTYADECDDEDSDCLFVRSTCALGTDYTDCGDRYEDDADVRVRCPEGSRVEFFTLSGYTQADVAALDCQLDGSCQDQLNDWLYSADPLVQYKPIYTCDGGGAYCDINRYDLRDGKTFMQAGQDDVVFPSFRAAMDSAFRYRTRFRSRTGASVGFAPEMCVTGSDAIPYCYDPAEIEELRDRADCLTYIWYDEDLYFSLADQADSNDQADDAHDALIDFLGFSFSQEEACVDGTDDCICAARDVECETYDGFERMYAELLVMLGDEALTTSFSSRFDLAGELTLAFEGDLFEEDGIAISGIAGTEMYKLYQANQYYQEALDRFYMLGPVIRQAVRDAEDMASDPTGDYRDSFLEPELVTTYFDRLMRAASQKTRAWNAVAERYVALGRADLGEMIVKRAYAGAYLENVMVARLMQDVRDTFSAAERPSVDSVISSAEVRFGQGMVDMMSVYRSISDESGVFGVDPDFVPFPTHSGAPLEDNAFEKLLNIANRRIEIAASREENALSSSRAFDTDAAEFQSELVRIRTTYESQLGEVCGIFEGDDGRIYPATRRYASESTETAVIGDPCGLVGNGSIFEAMLQIDRVRIQIEEAQLRYSNVFERMDIERDRVDAQCELIDGLAAFVLCAEIGEDCSDVPDDAPNTGEILSLEDTIRVSRTIQQTSQQVTQGASAVAEVAANPGVGTGLSVGLGVLQAANVATFVTTQVIIDNAEQDITRIRSKVGAYQTRTQCTQLQIDSTARMREMMLELRQIDLEVARAMLEMQSAYGNLERVMNEAERLQLEQEEVESMRIDVEAARNDPNVRIYRNDAILNADFAFEDALKWTYIATRMYEYYTGTTYASRDQLYLIRMVTAGEYNLQNYIIDLENAFIDFEMGTGDSPGYGRADLRVSRLSLMNDLLQIPYVDSDGVAYSSSQRAGLLREALQDPALLDENGYLSIPFSTNTDDLSPLTWNHKIEYIQVDYVGSNYGDESARFYLRTDGTGVMQLVDDDVAYYRLDPRTAVIDVMFGGSPYFAADVYPSYALRDRPYANTSWRLVINQRDERVNQDIDLSGVDDVRIDIYYLDFTDY